MLRHATCLHLTSSYDQRYVPGMITSLRSKYMARLSSRWADNQLAAKSLSHMQTLGYHCKKRLKYVITDHISLTLFNMDLSYGIQVQNNSSILISESYVSLPLA